MLAAIIFTPKDLLNLRSDYVIERNLKGILNTFNQSLRKHATKATVSMFSFKSSLLCGNVCVCIGQCVLIDYSGYTQVARYVTNRHTNSVQFNVLRT